MVRPTRLINYQHQTRIDTGEIRQQAYQQTPLILVDNPSLVDHQQPHSLSL